VSIIIICYYKRYTSIYSDFEISHSNEMTCVLYKQFHYHVEEVYTFVV